MAKARLTIDDIEEQLWFLMFRIYMFGETYELRMKRHYLLKRLLQRQMEEFDAN